MTLHELKPTPFVIGLTGTIGTGKSLVRKMLEHQGILSIDADQLAHGAYAKSTKGYLSIIEHFGNDILSKNGQIDRKKLGALVFHNLQALDLLEKIVHPLVSNAVDHVAALSPLPIIAVEAIKLLESGLKDRCDEIWVVTSPADAIYHRLSETRGMDRAQIDDRLARQPVHQIDTSMVNTTIINQGSIQDLWKDVSSKLHSLYLTSPKFRNAMDASRFLLEPFQDNLVSSENVLQAKTNSQNKPFNVLQAKYLTQDIRHFSMQSFDITSLEKNGFEYYFWKGCGDIDDELCLVHDMENFTAAALSIEGNFEAKKIKSVLNLVEDFSNLHLCETLFFSYKEAYETLNDLPGYKNCNPARIAAHEPTSLGYNLLSKQLRPSLDLFGKNQS